MFLNIFVSFRVCCRTSLSAIVFVPVHLCQLPCLLQKSFFHLPRVLQNTITTYRVCYRTSLSVTGFIQNILVSYRGCYRTSFSVTAFVTEHICQLPCLLQNTCGTSSYRVRYRTHLVTVFATEHLCRLPYRWWSILYTFYLLDL